MTDGNVDGAYLAADTVAREGSFQGGVRTREEAGVDLAEVEWSAEVFFRKQWVVGFKGRM